MINSFPAPKFHGNDDEDVDYFARKLEQYWMATNVTDASAKLGQARYFLHGVAEAWSNNASRSFTDYADFMSQLRSRFPSDISAVMHKIEGLQQRNTAVSQYAQDALNLHCRLPSGTMSERLLIKHFIHGLKPEISRSVHLNCPETVERAITLAKHFEAEIEDEIRFAKTQQSFVPRAPPPQAQYEYSQPYAGDFNAGHAFQQGRSRPNQQQQGNRGRQDNRGPPPPPNPGVPNKPDRLNEPWRAQNQGNNNNNNRAVPSSKTDTDGKLDEVMKQMRDLKLHFTQMQSGGMQANVYEAQPLTGQDPSSCAPDALASVIQTFAAMSASPQQYGFHSAEHLQTLSECLSAVQSHAQALAADKRPRPPGPPYQPNRHRPRFEPFTPEMADEQMRDAPAQPAEPRVTAREAAAQARRIRARELAASYDPMDNLLDAKTGFSVRTMCRYPEFVTDVKAMVDKAHQDYVTASAPPTVPTQNLATSAPAFHSAPMKAAAVIPMANKRPMVSVVRAHATVNGVPVPSAIIDTGSTNTVMSHMLYRRMGALDDLYPPDSSFLTSSGDSTTPIGVSPACMVALGELALPVDVQVTRANTYDLLVGMDWLSMAAAEISIANSTLTLAVDKGLRVEVPIRIEHTSVRQQFFFEAAWELTLMSDLFMRNEEPDTVEQCALQDLWDSGSDGGSSTDSETDSDSDADSLPDLIPAHNGRYIDDPDIFPPPSDDEDDPPDLIPPSDDEEDPPDLMPPLDDEDDDPIALFSSLDISPSPANADATGGNNSGQPDNTSPPPGGSYNLLGFTVHNSGPSDADDFCMEDIMPWEPQEDSLKLSLEHLSAQEQVALTKLLNDNIDVFAFTTGALGKVTTVEHVIPTGDAPPFRTAVRRFSQIERAEIERHVSEMLADGIIEVSHSPYRSSPVIVPKPRGGWRFCVNYRRLNHDTRHDSYAIPNITEVLDDLGPATHFSLLDMRAGYWQLGVSAQDRQKTAFWAPSGLYQFKVMPFGLSTAPATFQRFMDQVLAGLPFARAFLDDCCVFSNSFEEHMSHLQQVFARLRAHDIRLHPAKCEFLPPPAACVGACHHTRGSATP